ncbi:ABC-type bacteriocin/lantibiotic exporter, contains an N-terminal double-glycine peptidase domain [Pustulibacterium marinum]|uniref:ABC-type bacteriocin/lantibiotic exporter, contains an N-terminal double-glycine peptidase domain n=1 Tax=Pustulibacterium marinum TaxID=1224947 RepID=A0A1I7FEC6_9FLAO|nr:ATP-binding cassette domain-containing protein [Pustulibacterium marinum]SFU34537.1 ABC-type bacteriocin/lantibiotic exporter, contains an N-terminal double-glycine peptidase domain [Pustulibacterium marinum]
MTPIQRFKNLLRVDKKDIYQIILYSILAGIISLSLPLGIQSIVNFLQAGKVSTSWVVLVIIVVAGVAMVGTFRIMQYRITENLQQKIFVRSSFEFAYRFPKIKFSKLYNYSPPELANRFFDTLNVQKGFAKLLLDISGAALQIIFGILLLSFYHTFFIFFGILLIALLYLIFKVNFNNGLKTSLEESNYKYKVAHWLQEIARNHLSFKNNQLFNHSLDKNDELVNSYLEHRESHFTILRRQFIQLTGFKVLITAGLLIIGGILVLSQQMNIGQFVAAEIIILTIVTAVEKLFSGIELFYDVLTSLEKIGKVVDMDLEDQNGASDYSLAGDDLSIEGERLSYRFPDQENLILKNISLKIEQGDKIIIEGENGSGKTTLIRLLSRVIEPTGGTIFINNTNYKKYPIDEYRSNIGTITINDNVFEGTIIENMTCKNPNIDIKQVNKVVEVLRLTPYIKSLPNGLDTIVHSEGKQLNSSVVQKILLARCILSNPKILYLEEPLEKVDESSAHEIIDYLTAEDKTWTLVVISKNEYWKQKCNKRFLLEEGELKA